MGALSVAPAPSIRVAPNLARQVKSLYLCSLVREPGACRYVVALWEWAQVHAPCGVIPTVEKVEEGGGWQGIPGVLCEALVTAGWLDQGRDGFSLRGWAGGCLGGVQEKPEERAR